MAYRVNITTRARRDLALLFDIVNAENFSRGLHDL